MYGAAFVNALPANPPPTAPRNVSSGYTGVMASISGMWARAPRFRPRAGAKACGDSAWELTYETANQ